MTIGPLRFLCSACLALALAWAGPTAAEGAPGVAVVLGERANAYLEILDILRKAVGPDSASGAEVLALGWHELAQLPRGEKLIVAVGARALEALAATEPSAPVLACLLPKATFERIMENHHGVRQFSAIFMDQPPARQLDLLRLALPERRRVLALTGPESRGPAKQFPAIAAERGLHMNMQYIASEAGLYSALQRGLGEADLLLALPDPSIYNDHTISDILLTAYRYKVPVIGFSLAYVRAGALMALYSSTVQVGVQVADVAREVLDGHPLPPPQYPKEFTIGINDYVARSLGIRLDDEAELRGRLHQLEHHP